MKELKYYIIEDEKSENINEGFLMNSASKITLNKLSQQELLDGILNMYDYIASKDDIKLFIQDFPLKERLFWKNLYELHQKNVWSIIDMDDDYEDLKSIVPEFNNIVEITVQFRRKLRDIIKNSKNKDLELKASEPQEMLAIKDNLIKNSKNDHKIYILTINRTTGLFRRMFRAIDAKFLRKIFEKLITK